MAENKIPADLHIMRVFDEVHRFIGEHIAFQNTEPDEPARFRFHQGEVARAEAALQPLLAEADLQGATANFGNALEFARAFYAEYIQAFDPRNIRDVKADVDFSDLNAKRMEMLADLHSRALDSALPTDEYSAILEPIMQREIPAELVQVSVPDMENFDFGTSEALDLDAAITRAAEQMKAEEPAPTPVEAIPEEGKPEPEKAPAASAPDAAIPEEGKPEPEKAPAASTPVAATPEEVKPELETALAASAPDAATPEEGKPEPVDATQEVAQVDMEPEDHQFDYGPEDLSSDDIYSEPTVSDHYPQAVPTQTLREPMAVASTFGGAPIRTPVAQVSAETEPHAGNAAPAISRVVQAQEATSEADLASVLSERVHASQEEAMTPGVVGDIHFFAQDYTQPLRFVLDSAFADQLARLNGGMTGQVKINQEDVQEVGRAVVNWLDAVSNQVKKGDPFDNPYGPLKAALSKALTAGTLTPSQLLSAVDKIEDMDAALLDVRPQEALTALEEVAKNIVADVPTIKDKMRSGLERIKQFAAPAVERAKATVAPANLRDAVTAKTRKAPHQALADYLAHYPRGGQELQSPAGKDLGCLIKKFTVRPDGGTETQLGSLFQRATIVDNNSHLAFYGGPSERQVALLAEQAKRKGWSAVRLHGLKREQKSEAYIQMSLAGLRVEGYQPTDAELQKLQKIRERLGVQQEKEPDLRIEPALQAGM